MQPLVNEDTELVLPPMSRPFSSSTNAGARFNGTSDMSFEWVPPSLLVSVSNTNTGSHYVVNITYVELVLTNDVLEAAGVPLLVQQEFDVTIKSTSKLPAKGIIGRTRYPTYYQPATPAALASTTSSQPDQDGAARAVTVSADGQLYAGAAMNATAGALNLAITGAAGAAGAGAVSANSNVSDALIGALARVAGIDGTSVGAAALAGVFADYYCVGAEAGRSLLTDVDCMWEFLANQHSDDYVQTSQSVLVPDSKESLFQL